MVHWSVAAHGEKVADDFAGPWCADWHVFEGAFGPGALSLGISAANVLESLGLQPLVRGIPPVRTRRGPRRRRPAKLHGDKGYDYDHLRR